MGMLTSKCIWEHKVINVIKCVNQTDIICCFASWICTDNCQSEHQSMCKMLSNLSSSILQSFGLLRRESVPEGVNICESLIKISFPLFLPYFLCPFLPSSLPLCLPPSLFLSWAHELHYFGPPGAPDFLLCDTSKCPLLRPQQTCVRYASGTPIPVAKCSELNWVGRSREL